MAFILTSWSAQPPAAFADDPAPSTTEDPQVAVEELRLMLLPLTANELEVEAKAWLGLLKSKVEEISAHELAVRRKNRDISKAKQAASEAKKDIEEAESKAEEQPEHVVEAVKEDAEIQKAEAEAQAERRGQEKIDSLETLTKLREERAVLTDRTDMVLDEWEKKGGDVESARKYVSAVGTIAPTVDVTDASATWVAIKGWLMSKEGGWRWGKNIVMFVVTILVFIIIARIAGSAARRAMTIAKTKSDLLKEFITKLVRRSVFFVGFVVALSAIEVPISPFLAAIGGAALVIGLALQGTLSNFASGIMILLHRPFDVGDVINVAGVSGTVDNMSILSTQIRTFDNQQMIVPNNSIWGGVITNVTGKPTRRVDLVFGIAYDDDIEHAKRVLEDAVASHELVLKDPAPTIKLHELADSSVNFIVRPWTKTSDYWTVYWDVTWAVKQRFDAEGISIPFPQRDVHVHQSTTGSAAAVEAGA